MVVSVGQRCPDADLVRELHETQAEVARLRREVAASAEAFRLIRDMLLEADDDSTLPPHHLRLTVVERELKALRQDLGDLKASVIVIRTAGGGPACPASLIAEVDRAEKRRDRDRQDDHDADVIPFRPHC